MKILVDENIPSITVEKLIEIGHDVLDIRGTSQEGVDDEVIWQIAQRKERFLITTDKGFNNNRDKPHYGILIVRLRRPNQKRIQERILFALNKYSEEDLIEKIIIVRDNVCNLRRVV